MANRQNLIALGLGFIGLLIVIYFGLWRDSGSGRGRNEIVGAIESFRGYVQTRLPRALEFETVSKRKPLFNQELVATNKGAEAVLSFSTLTSIQVTESTKFVVEDDATRPDSLIGTVIEGRVIVLNPGPGGRFRLYYQGRELPLDSTPDAGPQVIQAGPASSTPGLTITATLPEETTEPALPTPGTRQAKQGEDISSDVLTNEDVIRQLRGQTGFFQRCYLSFINRAKSSTNPSGVVTLSFRVQNTGRVTDTKLVRSDFKDQILHRCVLEVVERARFKRFQGTAVPVLEFPIKLQ